MPCYHEFFHQGGIALSRNAVEMSLQRTSLSLPGIRAVRCSGYSCLGYPLFCVHA
jgi:hypothetical protein